MRDLLRRPRRSRLRTPAVEAVIIAAREVVEAVPDQPDMRMALDRLAVRLDALEEEDEGS
jgi:hypothetical protein